MENVPLLPGTNYITLTAVDAVGNTARTNLAINCLNSAITIDDFSSELGGNPRNIIPVVTGTIDLTNYTLWVNGIEATQNGDGTWEAYDVPVRPGGTAVVEARAIPNSEADNNGNGTGTTATTDGTPSNPAGPDAIVAQTQIDQPPTWYMQEYVYSWESVETEVYSEGCDKGLSTRQNLFEIDVSALNYITRRTQDGFPISLAWNAVPVPPADISVAGKTPNASGQIFTVLPDNVTMDITPQAPPQRYSYSVGATKYPASLQVFVCQPYPYYPNDITWYGPQPPMGYPTYQSGGVRAGHAWWQLNCGAPSAAINEFTSTNNSRWLNQPLGYGPKTSIIWTSPWSAGSAPGLFPFPNTDPTTAQGNYAIGFYNLIGGLVVTEDIDENPATYIIPGNTCVTATRTVGAASGIQLPDDIDPEFFGFHLPPSSP